MKKLGLIGHPVGHSKSPSFFKAKLNQIGRSEITYEAFDLYNIEGFSELIESNPELIGLNVTIPHKESIIDSLCCLDETAKEVGAVNTLVKTDKGWKGYNTDVFGFSTSIKPFLKGRHERALIFGTGGAAKAVDYSLRRLGIQTVLVSRTPVEGQIGYKELTTEALAHYLMIVNCTPLGTWPKIEECVDIPWDGIGEKHLAVDLVYNPEETTFIKRAKARGAFAMNGRDMLRLQAERSLEIWLEHGL